MKTAAAAQVAAPVSITLPVLGAGEIYAGILLDDAGTPTHHVILIAGELKSGTHKQALEWAAKQHGELPTRRALSLLNANCKAEFQRDWYWSGETPAGGASYAWYQYFNSGYQYWNRKSGKLRARAVRRLPIQ